MKKYSTYYEIKLSFTFLLVHPLLHCNTVFTLWGGATPSWVPPIKPPVYTHVLYFGILFAHFYISKYC